MIKKHTFHIPVMGVGYTVDTPLKVSQFGIDSVISIVNDNLLERIRKMYCDKFGIQYEEITTKDDDYRAKRISSYLNLINNLAKKNFDELKNSTLEKLYDLKSYFNTISEESIINNELFDFKSLKSDINNIGKKIKESMTIGSIDVNIMTKVDKDNYNNKEKLPIEYNDAHAALRGFANSDLSSSIVFSAGMNPRLYGYMEQFEDFFPDKNGLIKKKIIIKVSDYRSAFVQGKFLAKKGLWVSEFRVESGLNCGGHAFATDGFLLGPILEEFKDKKNELIQEMDLLYKKSLEDKKRFIPKDTLPIKITTQGGVGTSEEHHFLIDHYNVDSVGWGSPFLLVPEVSNVDEDTLNRLINAKEEDLYLSNISPLGVPFNNLRGNSKEIEKLTQAAKGKPGSSCPHQFLSFNQEFTEIPICTASRQYQKNKITQLNKENLKQEDYKKEYDKIIDKECLCAGLNATVLLKNNINKLASDDGVTICPGPNIAYFNKKMTLKEIIGHIYGKNNVLSDDYRPNMFVKELNLYIEYLKNKIEETKNSVSEKQNKYFQKFAENLNSGINYYNELFKNSKDSFNKLKQEIINDLSKSKEDLELINIEIDKLVVLQ